MIHEQGLIFFLPVPFLRHGYCFYVTDNYCISYKHLIHQLSAGILMINVMCVIYFNNIMNSWKFLFTINQFKNCHNNNMLFSLTKATFPVLYSYLICPFNPYMQLQQIWVQLLQNVHKWGTRRTRYLYSKVLATFTMKTLGI